MQESCLCRPDRIRANINFFKHIRKNTVNSNYTQFICVLFNRSTVLEAHFKLVKIFTSLMTF